MLSFWQPFGPVLLEGFKATCLLVLIGSVLATAFGLGIALLRARLLFPNTQAASKLSSVWIELFRNTPLLCQVLFFYYCFDMSGFAAVLAGLTTYTSAYMAEILRAGFQTVPQDELLSARLLGLSRLQTIRSILLPRALESVISPLGNQYVNLIKNTAIGYFVAVGDLTFTFEILTSQTYQFISFFLITLMGYYGLCTIATGITVVLENHLLRRENPVKARFAFLERFQRKGAVAA